MCSRIHGLSFEASGRQKQWLRPTTLLSKPLDDVFIEQFVAGKLEIRNIYLDILLYVFYWKN